MKKNTGIYVLLALIVFIPVVSFAALDGVKNLIADIGEIINSLKYVVFALAFVFFFWGMAQFILHSGDEKTRGEGKQKMLWGVIALFVMVSIIGILRWIGGTIGIPVPGATTTSTNTNLCDPANPNWNGTLGNC